jgi:hypothetical protein
MINRFLRSLVLLATFLIGTAHAQTAGWFFPSVSSYTASGTDNGKILSTDNVPGSTITVTLPNPATVGAGWIMGFSEANGRGVILNTPGAVRILAGQKQFASFSTPTNTNYEYLTLQSDGTNFRLTSATPATALFNGLVGASGGQSWNFITSTGYSATITDNGTTISSALLSGPATVTLPSISTIPNGWTVSLYASQGGNTITVQPNGVSGGTLYNPFGVPVSNYIVGGVDVASVSFDGGNFRMKRAVGTTDSQLAPIVVDSGTYTATTQPGLSAQTIYNQAIMNGIPTLFQGYDAIRGVASAPALSTVNTITGVAGYTINSTVPIGQRSEMAGLFGVSVCVANGSHCWGIDTIASDNPSVLNSGVTSSTGIILTGGEFDVNITSPFTVATIVNVGGSALPTNITLPMNGIGINKLWGAGGPGTGTALMQNGLVIGDACCAIGLSIGATTLSGVALPSMKLAWGYWAGDGSKQVLTLAASASGSGTAGTLFIGGAGAGASLNLLAGSIGLASGWNITSNGHSLIGADGVSLATVCNDATWAVCNVGFTSTTVKVLGALQVVGVTGGTPVSSVCFDAGNNIVKKSTSGPCI